MTRALSEASNLGTIDGFPVVQTTIKVTNAGDGLSQAMKIDPHLIPMMGECVVVLRCHVGQVAFKPGDGKSVDADEAVRIQTLVAGTATIIDSAVVDKALDAQAEAIKVAAEAEAGIQRLQLEEREAELAAAEEAGD